MLDFLNKADLSNAYGCTHPEQFAKLIGEKGRKILVWTKGKQRFTPKQIRQLRNHIGLPLSKEEKYV